MALASHNELPATRILVVDDQATVRGVLKTVLESLGFTVVEASNGQQAITLIENQVFDLVMLDVVMPDLDGLVVLNRIREQYEELDLPVIMVSVVDSIDDVVTALNEGANDYITKPIEYSVLEARVRQLLSLRGKSQDLRRQQEQLETTIDERTAELTEANERLKMEIKRRENVEAELKYQAEHDYLTRLQNRRAFENIIENAVGSSDQDDSLFCLCYIDVDQFKIINDTRGHAAGDNILVQLARLIETESDENARVGRIGGDELAVLYKDSDAESGLVRAESLVKRINQHRFMLPDDTIQISSSIGVVFIDDTIRSTSEVLVAADTACYLAKEEGGNRAKLYQAGDEDVKRRSADLHHISELTKAIEEHRLELWGQPIFPIDNLQEVAMLELLLRVRTNFAGRTDTTGFVRSAEHFRYITELDKWVFDYAYQHIHDTRNTAYAQYNVNLSGRSISDSRFVSYLVEALSSPESRPEKFCFEITETAAVRSLSDSSRFVEQLRGLGCSVVLDDFGSGESSLNYLKRLPVNAIKIQGEFIQRITESSTDKAIVRSIVNLARELRIFTVAEFARPGETLVLLQDIGVDFVQGQLIAPPRPLSEPVPNKSREIRGSVSAADG